MTVVENIELPLYYQRQISPEARERCIDMAELVGLGERLDHRPSSSPADSSSAWPSPGPWSTIPHVILADEPTGNLDTRHRRGNHGLLEALNRAGKTIIMVTHEHDIAARANRTVHMRDGHIEQITEHRLGSVPPPLSGRAALRTF